MNFSKKGSEREDSQKNHSACKFKLVGEDVMISGKKGSMLRSLLRKEKLFVHFVLDPINISSTGTEASFEARYGCVVFIENVERLDVGALVSIRGIGRVKIVKFLQLQSNPYLIGEIIPMQDWILDNASNVNSKVTQLNEALYSLNSLEIKLKDLLNQTFKLQQKKLRAMDVRDTLRRLNDSLELVNENISIVAAKLAIQSLEMQ